MWYFFMCININYKSEGCFVFYRIITFFSTFDFSLQDFTVVCKGRMSCLVWFTEKVTLDSKTWEISSGIRYNCIGVFLACKESFLFYFSVSVQKHCYLSFPPRKCQQHFFFLQFSIFLISYLVDSSIHIQNCGF